MSGHCAEPVAEASLAEARASSFPIVAMIGRPNSGKSSLYNTVTGGHAVVGNYPGITVDVLEGEVSLGGGAGKARVADLPGFYSLEAVVDPESDEGVARGFLESASRRSKLLLLQVIDATHLALGLRLTRELVRQDHPVLLAVTQRDALEAEGREIDVRALEEATGLRVVYVSARDPKARGVVLSAIEASLADAPRLASTAEWTPDRLARAVVHETSSGIPARARRAFTARADAILLHPVLGPFLFLAIMATLFAAVFLVSDPVTSLLDRAVSASREKLEVWLGAGLLASFVSDGVLAGTGTVLAFMPQIVILTVAMEILDASGYLARGAFLVDRLLRTMGLSGRSFLPLLMAHACAIPAIQATRVVRDPRERLTTILILPLMTCSARLPTYALLIGAFFATRGAYFRAGLFVALYFAGILAGLLASAILRRTATRGRALPLLLEIPPYRLPQPRVMLRKAADAATRFVRDVGTTILGASCVLWVLLTVPMPGKGEANSPPVTVGAEAEAPAEKRIDRSIAAHVGKALEPVTEPLGFDWRINVGLIGSFGARELMVGTLGVIFGVEGADEDPEPLSKQLYEAKKADGSPSYSGRTALALLAFFVIACQCMSTLAAIRRETKTWRWPAFVLVYTYVVAYAVAFAVHQIAGLFGVA